MEKRYLINNEVYQGSEMPKMYGYGYKDITIPNWKQSLVKLDCDESELDKINAHYILNGRHDDIYDNKIIDITSITTVKDGKVYFKEVESESNDVWIEFEQAITEFTKEFVKVHEVAPHPFDIMFWLKENKQFTITRK